MSAILDSSCGKAGLDRFLAIDKIDDFCQDMNGTLKKEERHEDTNQNLFHPEQGPSPEKQSIMVARPLAWQEEGGG
jgi:hypothetical protein